MLGHLDVLLNLFLSIFLQVMRALRFMAMTLTALRNVASMLRLAMFSLVFLNALAAIYPRVNHISMV